MKKLINRIDIIGLAAFALAGVFAMAGIVQAQTAAEVLAAANAGVCDSFSLAVGCTDAQVLTAYCTTQPDPCVDNRTAAQKIYATPAAYANAVLLPPQQKAIWATRRDAIWSRLLRIAQTDNAKCVAILTAAGIADQTVCK